MDQARLGERCDSVARLCGEALEWISDPRNAETVGPELKPLTRSLRRGARRAARLARSARTKMSVSVFGPSQAGKSFLVSVLARPADGRLAADFNGPGGKLDYISQINPAGDGESTGLVTRFTMTKAPTPDGFPIQLNLLSEADIARVIINSFYEDGDQSEPQPEAETLREHFQNHTARAQGTETAGLGSEEIFEIAEYVENNFGKTAYASGLKGFWDEAAQLAPRMTIPDRGAFLSILWGGYPELTSLYVKLSSALARIDHAEVVYAPLAALQPRETSIIDVNTLQGLFEAGSDPLTLRTAAGRQESLDRAVVCALAAELVFPMESLPSPLFAETDLLDFPGARNRPQLPIPKLLSDPEKALTNMLLRGKVAYLFDRYVTNQEITSMLLCVPDSNMETLSLPGLVDSWIGMTHGATARERENNDCILFFVLTKFDKHLGDSASGGTPSERFERRMDASLLKGFGRLSDSWVHRWTTSQPFQNCYWLRNPNYFVEGLLEYDSAQRETAIRAEKLERLAELRAGCLETPAVRAHFKDPEAAWDAALTLNDGGVGYLTAELAKVCTPRSKLRQISAQIEKIARDATHAVGGFHVSDDIEQRIEEKRVAAANIIDGLEYTLRCHRFGSFLHALSVDQDSVQDRIARVPSSIRISNAVSSASAAPAPGAAPATTRPTRPGRPIRPPVPGGQAPATPAAATADAAAEEPRGGIRTMTPEQFQASTAIDVWVEGLRRFREDEAGLAVYGLDAATASDLTSELIHGLRRTGVPARIMTGLKAISYGLTVDKQAPPAAIVCGEEINRFVATLSGPEMSAAERPAIALGDGTTRPAFAERPDFDSADCLPYDPRPSAEDAWTDWVFTLEALLVGNAKDTAGGGALDIEQNSRLGRVLAGLGSDEAGREAMR